MDLAHEQGWISLNYFDGSSTVLWASSSLQQYSPEKCCRPIQIATKIWTSEFHGPGLVCPFIWDLGPTKFARMAQSNFPEALGPLFMFGLVLFALGYGTVNFGPTRLVIWALPILALLFNRPNPMILVLHFLLSRASPITVMWAWITGKRCRPTNTFCMRPLASLFWAYMLIR